MRVSDSKLAYEITIDDPVMKGMPGGGQYAPAPDVLSQTPLPHIPVTAVALAILSPAFITQADLFEFVQLV